MSGLVLVLLAAVLPCSARGQAGATATKTLGLSAFGGGSHVTTDYSAGGSGFIVGGDVTRHLRWFDPSLEVRFNYGEGPAVTEKTFEGGVKVEKPIGPGGRFHPYADFLLGYGVIDFKHPVVYSNGPYASDNSIVYGVGGGLDFDVSPQFAIKGEYQYSHWSLGTGNTLTPTAVSGGIVYRFHFRELSGRHSF
jgi:opacity protein-like surface antigen